VSPAPRLCLGGCGRLTTRSDRRCGAPGCRRSSSTHNGNYGDHRRWRAELERTLPAPCAFGCGRIMEPGSDWVAAHVYDGVPDSPRVVSCRSCNERAKR
jgi:hypothetical protein